MQYTNLSALNEILKPRGCALRPIAIEDADAWFEYLTRPNFLAQTSWNLSERGELLNAIETYISDKLDTPIRFAIVSTQTQALMGTIGFHSIVSAQKTGEIAYDIHPDFGGRGIATHCCRELSDWALKELGWVRVQALVLTKNERSKKVLERSGFQLEGIARNIRHVQGVPSDYYQYSKIAPSTT